MERTCYDVTLQSPLGPRFGELVLQEDGQVVSGHLTLLGRRSHFTGTILKNGRYLISGELRTPMGQEFYDAIFSIHSGRLNGGLISRYGCWDLTGTHSSKK